MTRSATSSAKNRRSPAGGGRRSKPGGSKLGTNSLAVEQALESLIGEARAQLSRHPLGHLVNGRQATLELTVQLPLLPHNGDLTETVRQTESALADELEALLAHRAVFRPGHVLCLRCSSTECEHAVPGDSRQIFAGYGSSGKPRFADFGQWLLERQHPRVDQLYHRPYRLITEVVSGRELASGLVDAFRDQETEYHVHGQVLAGWFAIKSQGGMLAPLALTFQVISSARRGRRRLGLNVLGAGPDGEPLRELYDRLETLPWTAVVHWAHSVLASIERSQGRKNATPELLSGRIEGLLNGIARRLEQRRRARDRRTHHAEEHHTSGDRPTRMALTDLVRASKDDVLVDARRNTLIVLGERGRAHVFNVSGKLVTSIRYSPESIARKRQLEHWRPAKDEEIAAFKSKVAPDE